jgi:hypothetical protein
VIGIIGGSGLYQIDGLESPTWRTVDTPWGRPSDEILTGGLAGMPVAFLPRHGRGHRVAPSDLNYRANIAALRQLGATQLLSLSAVGSLRDDLAPGTFVVVDQFVDRTCARAASFFGDGLVGHVSMADPVCTRMGDVITGSARDLDLSVVRGGAYLVYTVRTDDKPDGDIEIVYTGLKPGEKLHEELLVGGDVTGTEHRKILRAEERSVPWPELRGALNTLEQACDSYDFDAIMGFINALVEGGDLEAQLGDLSPRAPIVRLRPPEG